MAELDRERILSKIDQLDGYLRELEEILPRSFGEYQGIEKKRACERLLQISIEAVIDLCGLLVSGLRFGLPADEGDLITKAVAAGVLSEDMGERLRRMKGLRNVLVYEYARVDDRLVYAALTEQLDDFLRFRRELLDFVEGWRG